MSKLYHYRLRSASRIQQLKTQASFVKGQRSKMKMKTAATNTPQKCHTSTIDSISSTTFQAWNQLLFNRTSKRQKSTLNVKASPLEYVKLMEQINKNKFTKQSIKQNNYRQVRRMGRLRKLDPRITNQFQKYSIHDISRQIMNLIQSANDANVSNDRLIKMIQNSLRKPELQKIFLKKNKLMKPVSIIKTHEQLSSNIKMYYLSNPDNCLFMYLKQFKTNLQKRIAKIDNSMLETLEKSIEKYQRLHTQNNQKFTPRQLLTKPGHINILNKIKEYEKSHGELGMISEINRKRYQVFDRINMSLEDLEEETSNADLIIFNYSLFSTNIF